MRHLKAAVVSAALSIVCSLIQLSDAYARATEPEAQAFDIEPQSLATALTEFARQSRQQILYAPEVTVQRFSAGVTGVMPPLAALRTLLKDSDLSFTNTPNGAILVGAISSAPAGPNSCNTTVGHHEDTSQRAAVASQEIVVMAQKRSERLQDVPVEMTAINTQALVRNNQVRLQDYYVQVPGVDLTMDNRGAPTISIRGLTTGAFTSQTTTVTLDDVPYSAWSSVAFSWWTVEIDPNELTDIEILRGPQGTLYGASSLGGLIRYTTISPSTEAVSGRITVGVSGVSNGHELGINGSGAINVPLSDTAAVRLSGFSRAEPGFITNINDGRSGVNSANTRGGRLSFLWQPSDDTSVKIDALLQDRVTDGSFNAQIGPGLGDLEQNYLPGTGGYDRFLRVYDATIKAKIGDVTLTSISAYGRNSTQGTFDLSFALKQQSNFDYGPGVRYAEDNVTHTFAHEIRLTGTLGERIDWLAGGAYTYESTDLDGEFWAAEVSGKLLTQGALVLTPFVYEEYAFFSDLTFHITDRFNLQVGGRESIIRTSSALQATGTFLSMPDIVPRQSSRETAFTYLVTPQYKLSADLMAYARFASGYRPGGPNVAASFDGIPPSYGPDMIYDSEVGIRGNAFGHRLTFDAAVYHIDWDQIQVPMVQGLSAYTANEGGAKSEGVELNIGFSRSSGTSISCWVAYDNAVLTRAFGIAGLSGGRLPYAARLSGSLSLTQPIPIANAWKGSITGELSYVGDRLGELHTPRQNLPGFARLDLRAGIDHGPWSLTLYANNVTDRRGLLGGGLGNADATAFQYITPRTVGASVSLSY